ncbi:tyrosine--tRNA ligase [Cesiribacter sp. SM1]|uniref:tyrosine--tRNA ligase n=1 Tax=Cesiribacter sp. SM1 TaxID=2861196 RepID=UPI001CD65951|nr:tyrosine--tRNA ligase [Cesiribacter sp. SM1]
MKDLIAELRWRGMIHDMTPGTEEQLQKEMTAAYIGFDPTASSLHIGNLATVMLLVHLQQAGHKPYALVGGATGMVGDPSFKNEERGLLDEETLATNQAGIKKQLENFLDFSSGNNSAVMLNNYDWFKDFSFLHFIRDVGKHMTINYMMSKDSVKKRLETGISFTEFSYQLLQGYDFYHLNKTLGVKLQMGGSDQWGNITTGTELIRRMGGGDAFALTAPLVTKADGTKFGKSESGNVWLDAEFTSPYQFYQFWLNVRDEDLPRLLRVFTLLDEATIQDLESRQNPNEAKRALAEDVTTRVHGSRELDKAIKASNILFGKSALEDLREIDERTLLQVFEGVPQTSISRDALGAAADVAELLSATTGNLVFTSKGEARRMIQGGGVSINKVKVEDAAGPNEWELLQNKYLLVQKGKKSYFLISVQ